MMGWTYCASWKTRQDVVDDLLQGDTWDGCYAPIVHELTPDGLWCIARHMTTKKAHMWVDLIQYEGGSFGYKSIDVGMGPYSHDCSPKFVQAAQADGVDFAAPDAAAWLARWETAQGDQGAKGDV